MNFDVNITHQAKTDIRAAYRWYEKIKTGLGSEFLNYVYSALQSLESAPFAYSSYRNDYRKMILNKFPYSVIFEVSEEHRTVTVLRILHQSRKPF